MDDEKQDPLGAEFYVPLRRAELASTALFVATAAVSVALLVVPSEWTRLAETLAIALPLAVMLLFCATLAVRLYFFPRAQRARLRDFLSHAYDKPLPQKRSVNYYNNSATTTPARVAAQVLESTFFTKSLLLRMCTRERAAVAVYIIVYCIALLYRNTDPSWLSIGAQVLFSEQILSRLGRLEWFRAKSESIYDNLHALLLAKKTAGAEPVEALAWYEIVKATSAVSVSSGDFEAKRQELNAEWEDIRRALKL